jgi:hypothetical protein
MTGVRWVPEGVNPTAIGAAVFVSHPFIRRGRTLRVGAVDVAGPSGRNLRKLCTARKKHPTWSNYGKGKYNPAIVLAGRSVQSLTG